MRYLDMRGVFKFLQDEGVLIYHKDTKLGRSIVMKRSSYCENSIYLLSHAYLR